MSLSIFILTAIKKIAKEKVITDCINLITKKDVNKVDLVLSYIGGASGQALKEIRKYKKISKLTVEKIAKNENIRAELLAGRRLGDKSKGKNAKWSFKKVDMNISAAKRYKRKWIRDEIKSIAHRKLVRKIPGYGFTMTTKNLVQAIHNKEGALKIARKAASLLTKLGSREMSSMLAEVDKYSSLALTANQFWKKISVNKSYTQPIINSSGGAKLRYIRQLKPEYQDQIFDREFWFFVNSPQTGNFDKEIHSYDPTISEYNVPIRGWGGTRFKYYSYYNKITIDSAINLCCNLNIDFGKNIFHKYLSSEIYTNAMKYWIEKDPNYSNKIK